MVKLRKGVILRGGYLLKGSLLFAVARERDLECFVSPVSREIPRSSSIPFAGSMALHIRKEVFPGWSLGVCAILPGSGKFS